MMETPAVILALIAVLAAQAPAADLPLATDAGRMHAPADAGRPHPMRQQVFIAPSGAPYRSDARGPAPKAAWFAAADTNHDGRLDAQEFSADIIAFVAGLDTNHDGVIDTGEVAAYEATVPELHPRAPGEGRGPEGWHHHDGAGGHGPDSPPPGADAPPTPPPPGVARFALLPDAEPVAAMDARHDGRITHDEVLAAAAARFAALDAGHRGFLTLKDLPETWAEARRREMRARFGQGGWGHGDGGAGGHGWGGGRGGGFGDGGPGGGENDAGPGSGMGGFGDGPGDPGAGGQ